MSTITQSPCKVRRRSPLSSTGGSTLCPTWIPRLERYNIWNKLAKNNIKTFASCMVTEAIVKKICIWDIWWEFSSGLSTVHLKQMMEIDEGFDHYDKSIGKKWVVVVRRLLAFAALIGRGFTDLSAHRWPCSTALLLTALWMSRTVPMSHPPSAPIKKIAPPFSPECN